VKGWKGERVKGGKDEKGERMVNAKQVG
jgi:hypothetical protein